MSTLTAVHYMSKWIACCFGGTERAKDIKEREHRCRELDGQQHEWHRRQRADPSPLIIHAQTHRRTYKPVPRYAETNSVTWDRLFGIIGWLCLFSVISEIESKTNPVYAQRWLWRWWETQRSRLNVMQKPGKIRESTVSPELKSPSA